MSWLLCDYGEVLCRPQPAETVTAMAELCAMARAEFEEAYWRHRAAYDRGDMEVEEYWSATIGQPPGARLGQLVDLDVAGWLHPDPASIDGVTRVAERGLRLAILSNAPREVAREIDALPWLAPFSPRIFSCDLRVVKPEPAAYALALERLGARPDEVIFVDDRAANVVAARAAGIRAEVYRGREHWTAVG